MAHVYMKVSINGGTPIAGWFTVENLIKMDDLGIPLFQEPPYIYIYTSEIYLHLDGCRAGPFAFVTVCCSQEISQKEIWSMDVACTSPLGYFG